MDDMDIVLSLDEYSIYKNNNYYLCIPNEDYNFYHVFMSFSLDDLTILSREVVLDEIRRISDSIYAVYKNVIYILPIIRPYVLVEAANENDDREYNHILNEIIQPITLSVYGKLVSQNKYVSQIIKMIKQNDVDKKIVGWLSMKLGNEFIKEITFDRNTSSAVTIPSVLTEEIIHTSNSKVISVEYTIDDIWIKKEEERINDVLKPATSPGFSALKFLVMMIIIFSIFGVIIGYLIIK